MAVKDKFEFVFGEDTAKPIEILFKILEGRIFDFSYRLASDGLLISETNQILDLSSDRFDPIRLEVRGKGNKKQEYLVFAVVDMVDLIVSVADWMEPLCIDLKDADEGKIVITNAAGDWHEIKIHPR